MSVPWVVGPGSKVSLGGGYAFIDSPIQNTTFEASIQDSDMHVLSLGAGYKLNSISFDFAFSHYMLNERIIDNSAADGNGDTVREGNGHYNSDAQFYAFNVGYHFGGEE